MAEIDQDNVNKILDALIKKGATPATEATLEEVEIYFPVEKLADWEQSLKILPQEQDLLKTVSNVLPVQSLMSKMRVNF